MVKKWIISSTLLLCLFTLSYASKGRSVRLTERGKAFVERFVPIIFQQNQSILKERNRILAIREYFYYTGNLSVENREYLKAMAAGYDYTGYYIRYSSYRQDILNAMEELLARVDVVPVRMVLAQAIIETAWGKSNAAQVTNNYFGITYRGSKGRLVTSSATTNYYLKPYNSLDEGIADYIKLLNTKRSYKKFRDIRSYCREHNLPLRSDIASAGLVNYSELRERYVAKINHVIHKYLLKKEILESVNLTGKS